MTVDGLSAAVGDLVEVNPGDRPLLAEVVAVGRDRLTCMPLGTLSGVHAGAPVRATGMPLQVPVGEALLGRVLDGLGRPVDGGPPLGSRVSYVDLASETPHVLSRTRVDQPLTFGVRALDTLVPCGKGQRLGIFAGSGVGKSSLLAQITRGTDADVRVIGLIGERGREVREFLEENLGPEGMARTVVVVATSDEPPLVRLKAAFVATRIAEALPRPGPRRAAADGLDHPHRHGPARGRPVRGRAAGHPRLPAERLRDDAAAAGEGRHRRRPARSPASTPCWSRATTTTSRSPTPPGRSSTGTSCSPASWRPPATSRRSTSSSRSPASPTRRRPAAADGRRPRGAPAHGRAARRQGAHRDRRLPGRQRPARRPRPPARAGHRGVPAAAHG